MQFLTELPRELQYNIARKLDIDSRRALGIYTKLKVPDVIVDKINKLILNRPKTKRNNIVLDLSVSAKSRYILVKCLDVKTQNLSDYRVIHERGDETDYYMIWCIINE